MSFKYLISGMSNTGKTTTLQNLEDVFVVAIDGKKYPFEQPHTNIEEFESVDNLIGIIEGKIEAYEEKFGKLPDVVAIDSVSRVLNMIVDICSTKFSGFTIWSEVNKEIHKFVDFTNSIVDAGMGIVYVAHALYDENTKKFIEVANGQFAKIGGFLSTTDYASFIQIDKKGNRTIHHKNPLTMSRSLIADMPDSEPMEEYNIQEYINKIKKQSSKATKFEL